MSSPIVHAAAGYAIYRLFRRHLPQEKIWGIPARASWPLAVMALSLLPDLDAVVGILGRNLERFHNNLTHSLVTALIFSAAMPLPMRWIAGLRFTTGTALTFAACIAHLGLDLLTDGRGLMLAWPFTDHRFYQPVILFSGVPWSHAWSDPLYVVMLVEDTCFALLVVLVIALTDTIRRRRRCLTG